MGLKSWIETMPSTNVKLALGLVLTVLTALFSMAVVVWLIGWAVRNPCTANPCAELRISPLVETLYYGWMAVLVALLGFGYAQFRTKRMTDTEYVAATSGTPAPAATPPVSPVRTLVGVSAGHAYDPGA